MSFKSDIQATRSTAGNTGTAVIAGPIRLRAISIASDAGGAGELELTTTSNSGTTLLFADIPTGDVYTLNLPEDGILFSQGIFVKTKTKVAAFTLFTDVYNAPGLVGQNG
jgi:hypothetical protein